MRTTGCLWMVVAILLGSTPTAIAGGFAFSDNFIVTAPDQRLADDVLAKSEQYRKDLALQWLGKPLPPGAGRTLVAVDLAPAESGGRFWPIDDAGRKLHQLRLPVSPGKDFASSLRHEMIHLVMQIAFRGELPLWANEGIATLEDQDRVGQVGPQLARWYAASGIWPDLQKILQADTVGTDDYEFYSVSNSLTAYLLTRADEATLLKFAMTGKATDWNAAARQGYGLTLDELQSSWQKFATRNAAAAQARGPEAGQQPDFTYNDRWSAGPSRIRR